jgi:hypothetical protein
MPLLPTLLTILLTLSVATPAARPQDPPRDYLGDYTVAEQVVRDLYRACSFRPGDTGDWARMRQLIDAGAAIGQPVRGRDEEELHTLDSFIALFQGDVSQFRMSEPGFREEVVALQLEEFGTVTTARVVFAVYAAWDATTPQGRGVDYMHLVRKEGRWWVSSIATAFERPNRRIPAAWLGGGPGR